jgi:hypothetical protein
LVMMITSPSSNASSSGWSLSQSYKARHRLTRDPSERCNGQKKYGCGAKDSHGPTHQSYALAPKHHSFKLLLLLTWVVE